MKDIPLQTMGGGTYARALENCVAFGARFDDEPAQPHEVDERVLIKNLAHAIAIYTDAIYNLAAKK